MQTPELHQGSISSKFSQGICSYPYLLLPTSRQGPAILDCYPGPCLKVGCSYKGQAVSPSIGHTSLQGSGHLQAVAT
jgi:hypothetical protein